MLQTIDGTSTIVKLRKRVISNLFFPFFGSNKKATQNNSGMKGTRMY